MDKDKAFVGQATGAATAVVGVVDGAVVVDTVGMVVWATVVLGLVVVDVTVGGELVAGDAAGEDPQAGAASPRAPARNVELTIRRRRRER
jgi:hypothetical protein